MLSQGTQSFFYFSKRELEGEGSKLAGCMGCMIGSHTQSQSSTMMFSVMQVTFGFQLADFLSPFTFGSELKEEREKILLCLKEHKRIQS